MPASVSTELIEFAEEVMQAKGTLEVARKNVLEVVGVRLLSFAQQDYREKARGGTGADGVKWKAITRATKEARVRRRSKAKRIVEQRRAAAAQIRAIQAQTPKPKKWQQKIRKLRDKRKELSAKMQALIDAERAEIGVDTGLQRASASPGFQASDGQGGNLLDVTDVSVTVGYNRSYSGFFDAERPLFPSDLPKPWADACEKIVEDWATRVLTRELASGF